jgi:flagellin
MDAELNQLRSEIERISQNTEWNGTAILKGDVGASGTVTFQVGVDGGSTNTLAVAFGDMTTSGTMASLNGAAVGLNGTTSASGLTLAGSVLTIVDVAIAGVSNQRATFGATSNRLTHAVDNLTNIKTNAEASRSRILDTDYAAATSELARTQIIQQAGTAMLAQANQMPQSVLALLQ